MMASHHDALWAKLHDLELQLAAQKLLRAPRGEDTSVWATCRGRQYDAYMRRRDARREAASSAEQAPAKEAKRPQTRATRAAGGSSSKPMSPRAFRSSTTRLDPHEVRKTPAASIPSTPRRESGALPRSRTVNGGAGVTGSPPARSHHHQRRSSLGHPADHFGGSAATPRPFLKRGTGTGGAAAPTRLRVHDDLASIDVPSTPRRLQPERGHHARSVPELPFDTAALASSPQTQARARKRWGSPESPAAMVSAPAYSHRDLSKGLRKLLSFVRKGGKAGDADSTCPAARAGSP